MAQGFRGFRPRLTWCPVYLCGASWLGELGSSSMGYGKLSARRHGTRATFQGSLQLPTSSSLTRPPQIAQPVWDHAVNTRACGSHCPFTPQQAVPLHSVWPAPSLLKAVEKKTTEREKRRRLPGEEGSRLSGACGAKSTAPPACPENYGLASPQSKGLFLKIDLS